MTVLDRFAPVGAVVSAVSTMACCLPLPFAGALGAAGLGAAVEPVRGWLLGGSVLLLGLGFVQVYRQPRACRRTSTAGLVILWTSAILVALLLLFPQLVAIVFADWLR